MRRPTLALWHDLDDRAAAALLDAALEQWPGRGSRPGVALARMDEALRRGLDPSLWCVCLAPSETTPPALAHALIDAMAQQSVAALAIAPRTWDTRALSQADGACVAMLQDAPPSVVAAALYALLERQRAVRSMVQELATLQRYQGGLRSEIGRMHEELQLAGKVQEQMLPRRLPQAPGLEIETLFRPSSYVSGDIFDVQQLTESTVGLFLADAMGHGVPAALMTMVINRALAMVEQDAEDGQRLVPPAEALQRLNEALLGASAGASRFATAVYALLDTQEGSLRVAAAGHPPPVLLRHGDEEPALLETDGPLLGVFADADFTEVEAAITPGDALLLVSDGVEAMLPSSDVDAADKGAHARAWPVWRQFSSRAAEEGVHGAVEWLASLFDAQAGSLHQSDDVTVLAAMAVEQPARSSEQEAAQPQPLRSQA